MYYTQLLEPKTYTIQSKSDKIPRIKFDDEINDYHY